MRKTYAKKVTRETSLAGTPLTKTTLYVNDREAGHYNLYDKPFFGEKRKYYIHTWHITPPAFADVKADTEQDAIEMILAFYDYNPDKDFIDEYVNLNERGLAINVNLTELLG